MADNEIDEDANLLDGIFELRNSRRDLVFVGCSADLLEEAVPTQRGLACICACRRRAGKCVDFENLEELFGSE